MVIHSSESTHNINASVIMRNDGSMILYEMNQVGLMRLGINWKTGSKMDPDISEWQDFSQGFLHFWDGPQ